MCNSSQFGKECRTLGKIPLGAYLTEIAQFICRESLATHLLWLMVKFYCDGIYEPWKNWEGILWWWDWEFCGILLGGD